MFTSVCMIVPKPRSDMLPIKLPAASESLRCPAAGAGLAEGFHAAGPFPPQKLLADVISRGRQAAHGPWLRMDPDVEQLQL